MAFRFFRRKKLLPGVSLNLSKSGASLSFGPRGAKVTVGPRGVRKTVGVPGTGLYWTDHSGYGGKSRRPQNAAPPTPQVRPQDRLSLGFFSRLFTPQSEQDFVDGMAAHVQGDNPAALERLLRATDLADGAFMAGVLAYQVRRFDDAENSLCSALNNHADLGRYLAKYGTQAGVSVAITEHVVAIIGPDLRGVLLLLAETCQRQDRPREALEHLKRLYRHDPDDVVVRLSLAELLVEEGGAKRDCQSAVRLAEGIANKSEIHAGLLFYKAKALRKLGLLTAARETLSSLIVAKNQRSDDFLRAARYERALAYCELGWEGRYRKTLERIYAEDVAYEDVAQRLGLD